MNSTLSTISCKNNFGEEVDVPTNKFVFRPSAYGFIVRNQDILVMHNKSNKKLWFPGGGIEIHESLEEGLKREIKEETGLDIKVGKLVLTKENFFYYQPLDEAYHAFLFFYLCRPLTDKMVVDDDVDDFESEKPRWINIADIKKTDISDLSEEIDTCLHQMIV